MLAHWLACAVVYVAVSRLSRLQDLPRLAAGALAGATLAACVGLSQVAFDLTLIPQAAGPSATMANRDLAASYLVAVVPLALLVRGRSRWAVAGGLVVILGFLPFTRSRGAALAVALQLVLLVGCVLVHGRTQRARSGVPVMAAALALVTLGGAAILFWTATDSAKGRSLGIRQELAASAVAMGLDHPLRGVGLGRFGDSTPPTAPRSAASSGCCGSSMRTTSRCRCSPRPDCRGCWRSAG